MAGKISGLAEDAAIQAAGGGPEDPVADAAVAANQQRRTAKAAKKTAPRSPGKPAGAKHAKPRPASTPAKSAEAPPKYRTAQERSKAGKSAKGAKGPGPLGRAGRVLTRTGSQKLLVGEFVACLVILGLGTLLTPPKSTSDGGISRMMVKASGLCGIFLILGLVSAAGGKSAKGAGALGALITVGYIVSSPDANNIATWAANFFTKGGPADAAASATPKATTAAAVTTPLSAAFPLGHASDASGGASGGAPLSGSVV